MTLFTWSCFHYFDHTQIKQDNIRTETTIPFCRSTTFEHQTTTHLQYHHRTETTIMAATNTPELTYLDRGRNVFIKAGLKTFVISPVIPPNLCSRTEWAHRNEEDGTMNIFTLNYGFTRGELQVSTSLNRGIVMDLLTFNLSR
jgi:hypothetical protein